MSGMMSNNEQRFREEQRDELDEMTVLRQVFAETEKRMRARRERCTQRSGVPDSCLFQRGDTMAAVGITRRRLPGGGDGWSL